MATVSRVRLSYPTRLFLMLLAFSWTLVGCFLVFQYHREKQFKVEMLDGQLQSFNTHIIDELADGFSVSQAIHSLSTPLDGLRVTVIDTEGHVVYDNSLDTLPTANHIGREEIARAIETGTGRVIRRHSDTTDATYFYSATKGKDVIVRSAAPYDLSLAEVLEADSTFFWVMLAISTCLSVVGYFATKRIGSTIRSLNIFAEKAENGDQIYTDVAFPNDELGSISNHITRLYARLQQTIAERDSQHRAALYAEQEKIRIKKQLTNNINHELKTPVASIQVCLETIMEHPELSEKKRDEFIKRCYDNTERLRQLLSDISTITRMDDGARLITREKVVINDLVDEVVADVSERLCKSGMSLNIDFPVIMTVDGNASLLNSVFRNLIDNAISYSEGTEISIRMEYETDISYVISVTDNGNGIPEEHLPHIFERFYRVDKGRSRQSGGTGLGLAIVKNAVLLHGGTITAGNNPVGGLRMVFSLKKGLGVSETAH